MKCIESYRWNKCKKNKDKFYAYNKGQFHAYYKSISWWVIDVNFTGIINTGFNCTIIDNSGCTKSS